MNYTEKLSLARKIYIEMNAIVKPYEKLKDIDVDCCWHKCLWIGEDFFDCEKLFKRGD